MEDDAPRPEAHFSAGQDFPVQFAWRLPEGDFLRAVFRAEVIDLVPSADKYIVSLVELLAGREETPDGQLKPTEAFHREYWALVGGLIGRKLTIAYEADDSHAIYLRLETLTGEHNYFSRFGDAEVVARGLSARRAARAAE
jgi:hypothetical protein